MVIWSIKVISRTLYRVRIPLFYIKRGNVERVDGYNANISIVVSDCCIFYFAWFTEMPDMSVDPQSLKISGTKCVLKHKDLLMFVLKLIKCE